MSAHTPGPWKIGGYDNSSLYIPVGTLVRLCRVDGISERSQANARLIAAAPEMYGALEAMLGAYGNCGTPFQQDAANKASVALSKARGAQS